MRLKNALNRRTGELNFEWLQPFGNGLDLTMSNADRKVFAGFIMIALSILGAIAVWVWSTLYRIGPEPIEPLVMIFGWIVVLNFGAYGCVLLVRGAKEM